VGEPVEAPELIAPRFDKLSERSIGDRLSERPIGDKLSEPHYTLAEPVEAQDR
jgi:hypothetical protein